MENFETGATFRFQYTGLAISATYPPDMIDNSTSPWTSNLRPHNSEPTSAERRLSNKPSTPGWRGEVKPCPLNIDKFNTFVAYNYHDFSQNTKFAKSRSCFALCIDTNLMHSYLDSLLYNLIFEYLGTLYSRHWLGMNTRIIQSSMYDQSIFGSVVRRVQIIRHTNSPAFHFKTDGQPSSAPSS